MARELKRDGDWQKQTVQNFKEVAPGIPSAGISTTERRFPQRTGQSHLVSLIAESTPEPEVGARKGGAHAL